MTKGRLSKTKSIFTSFKDWPIAGKLLLLVLVPLVLTLAITQYLIFISVDWLETETSTETLQRAVTIFQQQFAEVQTNLLLNVSELTANPLLQDAVRRNDREALQSLLLSTAVRSGLNHLEVVDADGQTMVTNRNFNLSGTPAELEELHHLGLLQVNDAVRLILTPSGWLLATVRPIKLPSGEVLGALSIGRLLNNPVLSTLNFGRTDLTLVIFDPNGSVINTSIAESATEAESKNNLDQVFKADQNLWARAAQGETQLDLEELHGELYRVAYAPLRVKDQIATVFGVVLSIAEITELLNRLIVTSLILAGGLALLTILAALFVARRFIIRPVEALAVGAERLTAGQLDVEVQGVTSRDEIGMLAATFNKMAAQLRQTLSDLEDRSQSLELVGSLSDRLVSILNLEELLVEIVNQLKDRFDYYHVHIYLLDDTLEKLTVAEGTGAAGAEMKAKGHSISLNAPTSLVARAARSGKIVKVDNVDEAKDWLPNPLLPKTRSEMAVPIVLKQQVVGVLDVQQDKIAGLNENDVTLLHSLANQIAIAIGNARQFAKVEAALAEAYALQQQYIAQSWNKTRIGKKNVGRVQFSLGESTTLNETVITEVRQQAMASREPVQIAVNGSATGAPGDSNSYTLAAPIMLRRVAIGDLQLHDSDPNRHWSESELALISVVIDQVAQVAENLRLLDESQERASREQLISQISNKMRRAPDIESLMQVALAELSQVLEPARAFVHMGQRIEVASAEKTAADGPGEMDRNSQDEIN